MTCTVVDIQTAFLHRDLDEEIYMEVPKGLTIVENKKLILCKTIHGLAQSTRKFLLRSHLTTKEQRMKKRYKVALEKLCLIKIKLK
jgi:hypothetical protein